MKSLRPSIPVLAAVLLAVLLPSGCRETADTGRHTVPYVQHILSARGHEWSLLSAFDPTDPKGTIALVGPESRNRALAQRFLTGDDFDNIRGSYAHDELQDFAGERIDILSDRANTPYESFLGVAEDSLRTITVKNFLYAIDTALSIGAFDNERLERKENSKVVIFTSPLSAAFGAFDIDTLIRSVGKQVPVIFPARMMFEHQLDRNIPHLHVAVVTDSLSAESGVYPRLFDELAAERGQLGCGCVAFTCDSLSYGGSLLDAYRAAGGNMPVSAVIVDDPSVDIDAVRDSFDWIMRVQSEANLGYRRLITEGFTVIDARREVTDACYRLLRRTNNFTHNISYPYSKDYITVPASSGGGYNLVELY
jgi:hypothetical protein